MVQKITKNNISSEEKKMIIDQNVVLAFILSFITNSVVFLFDLRNLATKICLIREQTSHINNLICTNNEFITRKDHIGVHTCLTQLGKVALKRSV